MSGMTGVTPQQVTLTITVDVDPSAHGFGLRDYELEEIVLRAIDNASGLQVDVDKNGVPR